MRDQETDFACLAEEGDELRPMQLRTASPQLRRRDTNLSL